MNLKFLLIIIFALSVASLTISTQLSNYTAAIIATSLWATLWLFESKFSYTYALTLGVILDLLGFSLPLFWTIASVLMLYIGEQLGNRLLDIRNAIQSSLILIVMVAALSLLLQIRSGFNGDLLLKNTVFAVAVGNVLFYVIASKFKLFLKWRGKKI